MYGESIDNKVKDLDLPCPFPLCLFVCLSFCPACLPACLPACFPPSLPSLLPSFLPSLPPSLPPSFLISFKNCYLMYDFDKNLDTVIGRFQEMSVLITVTVLFIYLFIYLFFFWTVLDACNWFPWSVGTNYTFIFPRLQPFVLCIQLTNNAARARAQIWRV